MSKRQASKSDWSRVRRNVKSDAIIPYSREDGPYDPNDERATNAYLAKAEVRRPGQRGPQKAPKKQLVSIRLSQEVIEHFKATGPGWQTRIDEELKKKVRRAG